MPKGSQILFLSLASIPNELPDSTEFTSWVAIFLIFSLLFTPTLPLEQAMNTCLNRDKSISTGFPFSSIVLPQSSLQNAASAYNLILLE